MPERPSRLDLESALAALGAPGTAPAAGSAAALVGAIAAAVTAKVARFSNAPAEAAQAAALQTRLVRLAPADAEAFAAARAALADASDDGDERSDFRLGQMLARASALPLEIAEACADVAAVAGMLARSADPALQPDAASAALLAAAGAHAAALLVETNLAVAPGDPRATRAHDAARAAAAAAG